MFDCLTVSKLTFAIRMLPDQNQPTPQPTVSSLYLETTTESFLLQLTVLLSLLNLSCTVNFALPFFSFSHFSFRDLFILSVYSGALPAEKPA